MEIILGKGEQFFRLSSMFWRCSSKEGGIMAQQNSLVFFGANDPKGRTAPGMEWKRSRIDRSNPKAPFSDRKSTRLNSSHTDISRMPSSA